MVVPIYIFFENFAGDIVTILLTTGAQFASDDSVNQF